MAASSEPCSFQCFIFMLADALWEGLHDEFHRSKIEARLPSIQDTSYKMELLNEF